MCRFAIRAFCMLLALASQCSAADMPFVAGGVRVPLTSIHAARIKSTLLQQYDFSCGSAALATLLTFHFGYRVSEQGVFEEMFAQGDHELIRQQGFSLLDMKRYLAAHGFEADGFEQSLDKLNDARLPAIVLISDKGYNHFVVVKGLRNGRVLISDPASGTRAMPRKAFEALWTSRLLFVIHNRTANVRFDDNADWQAAPSAPLRSAGNEALIIRSLPRFGPGEF
jgi:predicted double-glycine peptidase